MALIPAALPACRMQAPTEVGAAIAGLRLAPSQACCFSTQVTALPSYGGMRFPFAIGAVVL